MKRLCFLLVIAIIADITIGLSLTPRRKRQSPQDEEDNLDDKYGWDRPPGRPWRRPSQEQNNRPDRPWNRPNQEQNNWPGPDQGQGPWDERPDSPNEWTSSRRPDPNQPQPTTPASNGGTTTQSAAIRDCIRTCPVTPEYNPVCGSNGQTYPNPGRLTCAQACGVKKPDGFGLSRKLWCRLNRLRTGHGRCNYFRHKWGWRDSALCDCGEEAQTIEHIVQRCPLHSYPGPPEDLYKLTPDAASWLRNLNVDL